MLVKIKQAGWETYSGDLGPTVFKDAVSVNHMSRQEALALGSYVHLVEVDDQGNELGIISPAHDLVRKVEVTAPVVKPAPRQSEVDAAKVAEFEASGEKIWTRAELEEIAQTKGIGGIREIADPLGIKGVSMKTLISEILARQPGS